MHRGPLLEALDRYALRWGSDEALERLRVFVESTPDCLLRSHAPGHVTGSALVTTPAFDRVLLTLHRKLGKWLQLGGHADGEAELHRVALQEAREESGLERLRLLEDTPFDVDVHLIPARPEAAEHLHYDVRYLVVTDEPERIWISDESHDLRWFTLEEARQVTGEPSMVRQFEKLEKITGSACPESAAPSSSCWRATPSA